MMYGGNDFFPRSLRHCFDLLRHYVDKRLGDTGEDKPKSYTVTTETVVPDDAVVVADLLFKVSDDTPDIVGWSITMKAVDGSEIVKTLTDGDGLYVTDKCIFSEAVAVAYEAGADFSGMVLPEAGLYMCLPKVLVDFATSITIAEPVKADDTAVTGESGAFVFDCSAYGIPVDEHMSPVYGSYDITTEQYQEIRDAISNAKPIMIADQAPPNATLTYPATCAKNEESMALIALMAGDVSIAFIAHGTSMTVGSF